VSLETDIGLNMVRSIYRDHRGYLWIGNQRTGLMRYDSYNIKTYLNQPENPSSISSNGIAYIYEDTHKDLWIGTTNGLNLYQPQKDNFKRYYLADEEQTHISANFINRIAESPDSTLWILTQDGLFKFNRETDSFEVFKDEQSSQFICISWDKQGQMWCGKSDVSGLFLFNEKEQSFTFYEDKNNLEYKIGRKTLHIDDKNRFWYGHRGRGFARFFPQKKEFLYFPSINGGYGTFGKFIWDIQEPDSINLLIGIDQGGVNIFNRESCEFKYITSDNPLYGELSFNGIFCIHQDYENITWVGTSRGGISYSNPKESRFSTKTPPIVERNQAGKLSYYPSFGYHTCFMESQDGKIWIGTDGGGINIYDRKTQLFEYLPYVTIQGEKHNLGVIRTISEDSFGNIWITRWEGEIIKYNRKENTYSIVNFEIPNLIDVSGNTYWSMHIDSKDRIWLSFTFGEVVLYNLNEEIIDIYYVGDNVNYMDTKFHESPNSEIFITSRNGIFKFKEKTRQLTQIIDKKNILSMSFCNNNKIWFGSDIDGVFQCDLNGNQLINYKFLNESKPFLIKGMVCANNKIWISTNSGIIIYDVALKTSSRFDKEDGLQGNIFFLQSVLKASDGELFFGGNNGFSSFYPQKVATNLFVPPVYITDLLISDEKQSYKVDTSKINTVIEYAEEVEIKWKPDLSIELQFVAISYTFPNKNHYAYMLEGIDSDWNYTDAHSRKAIYKKLQPGIYTFIVKASNNDNVWNEDGKRLKIIIKPPFYKTEWFYGVIVLVFILIIYLIIELREKKAIRDTKLLQEKVQERTILIQKQKEQLDGQNHLLEEQYEELAHKQERLRKQNEELFMHRTNLQKMVDDRTKDLLKAKEKAEEADRLKSSFLANMSHEIRTPMNAIVGFSSLLNDPSLSKSERENFVSMITSNSDVLLHLVEDILDFSLIESNQMKIHFIEVEINEILDNIYTSFALRNTNSNVKFTLNNTVKSEHVKIVSDEFRIRQILSNLIGNAIKFTEQGYIEIGAKKNDKALELFVKDTGRGMTKKEQQIVFKQFVKIEKDVRDNKRGIGLGLSISKRLSHLLHGQLNVKSVVNEGSEFILTLPLAKNH
jgi:signal transduction histidine kinase/ligand-binding sensor domain-containing protein